MMRDDELPAGSDPGMDMVCRFAGNLAHELNNLLTPVVVCGQMLADAPTVDDLAFCSEQLDDASQRFQKLTKKLQLIGSRRPGEETSRPVELLPEIIQRARAASSPPPAFRELYRDRPEVTSAEVALDHEQASFMIEELIRNAAQAMPNGGEITVDLSLSGDATRLLLTVTDQGEGMTPDVQTRMFEPFFSTRSQARDRGLGLSLVYGIVRRAGGMIRCTSTPGAGTTMAVTLPYVYVP